MEHLVKDWIQLVVTDSDQGVWSLFELALYDMPEIPVLDEHEKPCTNNSYIVMRRVVSIMVQLPPYWLTVLQRSLCELYNVFSNTFPKAGKWVFEDAILHGKEHFRSLKTLDFHEARKPKFNLMGLIGAFLIRIERSKTLLRSFINHPTDDVLLDVLPIEGSIYLKD